MPLAVIDAVFDEANLVSCARLVPVLALAEQAGLSQKRAVSVPWFGPPVAGRALTVASPNAALKVGPLVARMVPGPDSNDDTDRLRHGAMDRLFGGSSGWTARSTPMT